MKICDGVLAFWRSGPGSDFVSLFWGGGVSAGCTITDFYYILAIPTVKKYPKHTNDNITH